MRIKMLMSQSEIEDLKYAKDLLENLGLRKERGTFMILCISVRRGHWGSKGMTPLYYTATLPSPLVHTWQRAGCLMRQSCLKSCLKIYLNFGGLSGEGSSLLLTHVSVKSEISVKYRHFRNGTGRKVRGILSGIFVLGNWYRHFVENCNPKDIGVASTLFTKCTNCKIWVYLSTYMKCCRDALWSGSERGLWLTYL